MGFATVVAALTAAGVGCMHSQQGETVQVTQARGGGPGGSTTPHVNCTAPGASLRAIGTC